MEVWLFFFLACHFFLLEAPSWDMKKLVLILFLLPALIFSDDAALKRPVVLSVPKAGGHLALKTLSLFPETPKGQWADHIVNCGVRNPLFYDSETPKVIIVRDLRDVFVSLVYWFDAQIEEGLINRHLAAKRKGLRELIQHWRNCSFDEKLRIVLEDGQENLYYDGCMRENIEEACVLCDEKNTQVIRFEDLVGPKGGGNVESQKECIRQFAAVFSQDLKEKQVEEISQKMFGTAHPTEFDQTFRKGQIGAWKSHYNEKNLLLFYMRYGRYQKAFGYIQ